MRRIKNALLGASMLVGMFSCVPAQAADTNNWRQVGDWAVRIDPTMGNGCYTVASYTRGTTVRIGLDMRDKQGYLAVYADGLEVGKTYSVRYEFDGSGYTTHATAYADGNHTYLANWNMSVDAIVDFAQRNTLKVIVDGNTLAFVKLTGTYVAVSEMFECQKAQNARVTPPGKDNSANNDGPWSVPVQRQGSTYTLSAQIGNWAPLTFMLDTGASAVGLPKDVADRMGLQQVDTVELSLGDGSKVIEPVVLIERLTIGNVTLKNVHATVGPVGSPLLIGKNVLDRFSSFSIDNRQAMLILTK